MDSRTSRTRGTVGPEGLLELCLLVPEEGVRHPDLAGVRDGQVFDAIYNK